MKIIGLTGGIGSGKSQAAAYFREAGIPTIDADAIGHQILESDRDIRNALISTFGATITNDGAAIDRGKLAERVFADSSARKQVNALVHPAIIAEVSRQCAALYEAGRNTIIVEAALLAESGNQDPWLTALALVLASEQTRIERLTRHRGFTREEAQQRIAAQTIPESKKNAARWIIENNGDLDALHARVQEIAMEIVEIT